MKKMLFIILLFSVSPQIVAQITLSRLSFDIGYLSTYPKTPWDYKEYSVSPELRVGGKFIKKHFEWDISISYWEDGVDKIRYVDASTYSYSSTTLGVRLNYFPQYVLPNLLLPVHLVIGLSSRITNEHYVGGTDWGGKHRDDNSFYLYTVDIGGGLNVNIIKELRFRCDALVFIPINENENRGYQRWVGSLKIGIDYIFKH